LRTFPQFDPRISILLFMKVKKGDHGELEGSLRKELWSKDDRKIEVTQKEGWHIVEIIEELTKDSARAVSISPDLYKVKLEELKPVVTRVKEMMAPFIEEESKIHTGTVLSCGTKDTLWLKNYSDVSFLYKEVPRMSGDPIHLRGEVHQSNIQYLNRIMNQHRSVLINSLRYSGVLANLYMLGANTERSDPFIAPFSLLEIDMGTIDNVDSYPEPIVPVKEGNPYTIGGDEDRASYLKKQKYLVSLLGMKGKLIDILLLNFQIAEATVTEVSRIKTRGNFLLDEIYDLQNKINEHMKTYDTSAQKDKESKKKQKFLNRESYSTEKSLLTRASVQFSLVSEVENEIMRSISRMQDFEDRLRDRERSLGMVSGSFSGDEANLTMADLPVRSIEQERRSLRVISDELKHSREILTSTIEVLRTFIDTRQREVSEDMSRLMNLLFLVFACIGLADALGNFVILILQYGYLQNDPSIYDVYSVTSLGMILTLIPLLLSAVFLYLYFKKR